MSYYEWLVYLVAFFVAFSVTMMFTPFARNIAIKLNAIDHPKDRGIKKVAVPRLGGLAIVLGFLVSMFVLVPFMQELRNTQFLGFVIGAFIIIALGILDDIHDIGSKTKFIVQMVAALIVVFSGTQIEMVTWPFSENVDYLEWFSVPFTVIWIIGITNAVNLIDGVDGLAAGVSGICSFFLMVLCMLTGSPIAVIFTAGLAGSCLGFLPRNFNPAEVHMGDTGSTFLGFVLAVSSVMGLFKTYTMLALLVAILAMALPIGDTVFAMARRALKKQPIMRADRGHLHHRLIDKGYSQKQVVVILYAASIATGTIALLLTIQNLAATILGVMFLVVLGLMFYVYDKRVIDRS